MKNEDIEKLGKKGVGELIKRANYFRYVNDYEEALREYGEIWDLLMDEGGGPKWVSEKAGEVMYNISETLRKKGEFTAALLQLKQTVCFCRDNNDIIGFAYTGYQIPIYRLARGDTTKEVLPDLQKAESIIGLAISVLGTEEEDDNIDNSYNLRNMYQMLGYILRKQGKTEEATECYNTASEITEERNKKEHNIKK